MISILTTVHIYSISLKNTFNVARIRPIPRVITNNITNGTSPSIICHVGSTLRTAPTPTSTTSDIKNITKFDTIAATTYIYLGTYTFFIMAAFPLTAFSPAFVADEKNEYKSRPHNIYTGYVGSSFPNNVPNTSVRTIMVRSGSISVHKIPRYDLLYFNLIFFFTSSYRRYLYLRKFFK